MGRAEEKWESSGSIQSGGFSEYRRGCKVSGKDGDKFYAPGAGSYQSLWGWNADGGIFGWDGDWM